MNPHFMQAKDFVSLVLMRVILIKLRFHDLVQLSLVAMIPKKS